MGEQENRDEERRYNDWARRKKPSGAAGKVLAAIAMAGIAAGLGYYAGTSNETRSKDGDRWEGWVYPDRTNLSNSIRLGEFKSLEDCRRAAQRKLGLLEATGRGDYECGLNCDDGSKLGGVKVCTETLR